MKIHFLLLSGLLAHFSVSSAQDIEAKLPGSTGTQGFTVKDNSGTSLFTVRGDGKVGINRVAPTADLHIDGVNGLLVQGGSTTQGVIPASGQGPRLMWYSKKRAFRVGEVTGVQWNDTEIGPYSSALGYNTTASGSYSTALGRSTIADGYDATAVGRETTASGSASFAAGFKTTASGANSTAIGRETTASGEGSFASGSHTTADGTSCTAMGAGASASGYWSTALGESTTANAQASTAMGHTTTASAVASTSMGWYTAATGGCSTSMGIYTTAAAYGSTAIGRNNVGGGNPNNWVATDPLFEIGIGSASTYRANALTVLKNGNIGVNMADPAAKLHVKGSFGSDAVIWVQPTLWSAAGHYGEIRLGDNNHYIRGEYSTGMTLFDVNKFQFLGGNVGIATASPSYNLHVNGTAGKPGGGSWSVASDLRLKNVDGPYNRGLEDLLRLRPIRFHYKEGNPRGLPGTDEEIGFVAQEAREAFPESVSENADGYLDFNMHTVNVALVNAVKELKEQLDAERERNAALEQSVSALGARAELLEKGLQELRDELKSVRDEVAHDRLEDARIKTAHYSR